MTTSVVVVVVTTTTNAARRCFLVVALALLPSLVGGFLLSPFFLSVRPTVRHVQQQQKINNNNNNHHHPRIIPSSLLLVPTSRTRTSTSRTRLQQQLSVRVEATLDDDKIKALFAWIARAYAGEVEYNNLVLAIAAIFGDLPEDSEPVLMVERALKKLSLLNEKQKDNVNIDEIPLGEPFSWEEREYNSLGAMGAAQWTGRWRTRPHALLQVHNLTHIDQWVKGLPRGCRRTIQRAIAMEEGGNFTVATLPVVGHQPAPHSCLAHFRCVVEHEVRLLANNNKEQHQQASVDVQDFFQALGEAVGRYMGTTRMAGEIREYRNATTGRVIALAHEVRKGKTIRGQWFYATDEASKSYVWFHSVYDLVRRSIDADGVNVVDLGPSGSDAFSQLKERYGFLSVDDWPAVADYQGPFWYNTTATTASAGTKKGISGLAAFFAKQRGDK